MLFVNANDGWSGDVMADDIHVIPVIVVNNHGYALSVGTGHKHSLNIALRI